MPAPLTRRTEGATRYALLILLVLLAGAGGVVAWVLKANHDGTALPEVAINDSGQIHHEGMSGDASQLLLHARAAVAQQRLLAPAGDNAVAWYLLILKQQPDNRTAQDALRELFPFAATAAEQTIGQGNAAEAQRQIDLLSRADPTNYTLTILRAKLQAQMQVAEDQQRRDAQLAQAAAAKASPHAVPAPVVASPSIVTSAPVLSSPPSPTRPSASAETETPAATRANAVAPATTIASTAPVLTRRIEPYYPADARRTRRQGWVDVRFVVEADGSVSRASVVDADPRNVFDRAALNAVERWQFTPGTRGGTPASMEVRQRIDFRL